MVASAVAPGSGHVLLGHRRGGWLILGIYLIAGAATAVLGVLVWRSWETLIPYAVRPDYLSALAGTVVALAALWALVVLHASWTVLRRTRRTAATVLAGGLAVALCTVIAAPVVALSRYVSTTNQLIDGVFVPDPMHDGRAGPVGENFSDPVFADGRLNVLLIGGDAGDGREGLRADTVILASTEVASGRTVLVSLPRNLEDFPFARGSVMARQFPRGYRDCGFAGPHGCLLNSVYTWGQRHPHLFPDDKDPGAAALSSAVAGILRQPVEFWALVDMRGFRRVIDAVGGVTLRVDQRLPIGGVGGPITGYLEPGLRRLDGHDALWYARSRAQNLRGDYDRIDRQRCLIGALVRQVPPQTLLRNYQQVASATNGAVDTSIRRSVLADLVTLGRRVKGQPIRSLTLTPPLVPNTADPNIKQIRSLVREAITASTALRSSPSPAPSASTPSDAGTPSRSGSKPSANPPAPEREDPPDKRSGAGASGSSNPAQDLSSACS